MNKLSFKERIIIISTLEHVLFKIGVTDKRTSYFQTIKSNINFSDEDYVSKEYNYLVKSTTSDVINELLTLSDVLKNKVMHLIINLINSDPCSPISYMGVLHIKKITDNIYNDKL